MRRSMAGGIFAFAIVFGVVAGASAQAPVPATVAAAPPYRYVMGERLARDVASSTAAPLLDGTRPIVILDGTGPDVATPFAPAAWNALYAVRFTSAADVAAAFARKTVPPFVALVLYENAADAVPPTPAAERKHPGDAFRDAANVVRGNAKFFLAAGELGSDAASVLKTAGSWTGYLEPTQDVESDRVAFYHEIASMTDALWTYAPGLPFAVAVGDTSAGTPPDAAVLVAAIESVPSNAAVWLRFAPADDALAIVAIDEAATRARAPAYRSRRPVRALFPTLFDHRAP